MFCAFWVWDIIFTDASDQAAAAVLTQEHFDDSGDVKDMPIAYLSTQFSDTQFKWSTVVKEGYAIYYCVRSGDTILKMPISS